MPSIDDIDGDNELESIVESSSSSSTAKIVPTPSPEKKEENQEEKQEQNNEKQERIEDQVDVAEVNGGSPLDSDSKSDPLLSHSAEVKVEPSEEKNEMNGNSNEKKGENTENPVGKFFSSFFSPSKENAPTENTTNVETSSTSGVPSSASTISSTSDPSVNETTSSISTSSSSSTDLTTTDPNQQNLFESYLSNAPKDPVSGVLGGVKNIAIGVGAGVTSFVVAPFAGAASDGVGGFFAGLGIGTVGLVALPVAGVVSGVGEILGGIGNTPETVAAKVEGKEWDPIQMKWVKYSLEEESQRVFLEEAKGEAGAPKSPKNRASNRSVKDTTYYELLKINSDATGGQIKKAYYKEARACHPDKNPDDENAKKKFQELSKAYQILSDEKKREIYDKEGLEGVQNDQHFIDPSVFFTFLFGSEKFEPYIGTLKLASYASAISDAMKNTDENGLEFEVDEEGNPKLDSTGNPIPKEKSLPSGILTTDLDSLKSQNLRCVKIALTLVNKVEVYVEGQEDEFIENCKKDANELSQATFGPTMLQEIGWVYQNQGEQYLGYNHSFLGIEGAIANMSSQGSSIKRQTDLVGAAFSAISAVRDISNAVPKPEESKDENGNQKPIDPSSMKPEAFAKSQEAFTKALPVFVDAMWRLTVCDIQETLILACHKLTADNSVPEEKRKRRAMALQVMGTTFATIGSQKITSEGVDAQKQMEEALFRTMAAANGQEI